MHHLFRFILLITIPAISYCTAAQSRVAVARTEMRGVWIATVANIDWPSKPGLSSKQQKAEFDSLLNILKSMNMNAVFVQVRPAGDALYKSKLVPFSAFLTGKQGRQPDDPSYDPLEYMIAAAHSRGMEFHAWMNPYRATWNTDTAALDKKHPMKWLPANRKKEWFFRYGKKWYFNPANQEVRDYLTNVVKEVVSGYNVDGIHFDDYYYPYKESGLDLDSALNDYGSFTASGQNFTNIHDWRRDNVSRLIKSVSEAVNSIKPGVQFGISPFGVWRNKDKDPDGSDTRAGITCYDDSYADVLLWLKKDWIDYVAPQLYWSIGYQPADFSVLLEWWAKKTKGKKLYIGHAAYKVNSAVNDPNWNDPGEIIRQIGLVRTNPGAGGSIFFSLNKLLANDLGFRESLTANYYKYAAKSPDPVFASPVRIVKGTPTHIRETWLLCSIMSGEDINSIIRLNTKLHPADNRQTLSAIMNDATRNLYFFSGS
jgi:uncharacterized lipoprotein YddW (UPF0748 family)